jgi:ribosomal protein L31E
LEIKLEFKRNNINEKSVYDIECKYAFYTPEKGKEIISFKDENIFQNLKNENSQGCTFLVSEINNESLKDIKYHESFPINSTITNSTIKNENESSKQFTIEENKIDNKINNNITKKLTDYKKDNFASEEKILEFRETIYKHKKACDFIFQLNGGTLVSGGKDNTLVIYVERLQKKIEMNLEQYPYSISEKISDNENTIGMILCCEKNFIIIKLNTEDNSYSIETFLLPNIYSYYCCELTKDNYIISGESISVDILNLFDEIKERKIIKEFVQKKTYFSGIKINKSIVALISNRVLPNGEDQLIFYNSQSKKISFEIKGFSFNYSFTSLSLISIKKNELNYSILLCACKRYYPKQKNGILLVNLQFQDKEEVEKQFYPTNNFEVYCFCQILNFKKNNSQYEVEYEETNYFFVGGFDEEKREGKLKLYKILFGLKESLTKIKYLQDIEFDENKDFDYFESPISSIIQSKINGKIVVSCWDGNVRLFSIPNIDFYLKEEK